MITLLISETPVAMFKVRLSRIQCNVWNLIIERALVTQKTYCKLLERNANTNFGHAKRIIYAFTSNGRDALNNPAVYYLEILWPCFSRHGRWIISQGIPACRQHSRRSWGQSEGSAADRRGNSVRRSAPEPCAGRAAAERTGETAGYQLGVRWSCE